MDEKKLMATRQGFVEVFWHRLQSCRRIGKMNTMQQVYDAMDEEYCQEYGHELFPSYQAFKKYLYRHH